MPVCQIRVPAGADPVMVDVPARTVPEPGPPPAATIVHHQPGEILLTCICRLLREAVDVDDTEIRAFLLVDDTRTGLLSSFAPGAQPETSLVLTAGTR